MSIRQYSESKAPTLFVDLDGTLVFHSLDPLGEGDVFLPGAVEWLLDAREKGYYIILVTGRTLVAASPVLRELKERGFGFDRVLLDLPTGERTLINDLGREGEEKALSKNVTRDLGVLSLGWLPAFS